MSKKAPDTSFLQLPSFDAIYPGTSQKITTSGSSQQSSAFSSNTTIVRLFSTQDCYVAFGTNPTATSSSMFLPAGIVEYFGVTESSKLAVLQVTSSGILYITEGEA